jgi:hypothetical protein
VGRVATGFGGIDWREREGSGWREGVRGPESVARGVLDWTEEAGEGQAAAKMNLVEPRPSRRDETGLAGTPAERRRQVDGIDVDGEWIPTRQACNPVVGCRPARNPSMYLAVPSLPLAHPWTMWACEMYIPALQTCESLELVPVGALLAHLAERSSFLRQQVLGRIVFEHRSAIEHEHLVVVDDCAQSMRDRQHEAVCKLGLDRVLQLRSTMSSAAGASSAGKGTHDGIRLEIDTGSRLVHDDDLGSPQQRPRHREQLPLSAREVQTPRADTRLQPNAQPPVIPPLVDRRARRRSRRSTRDGRRDPRRTDRIRDHLHATQRIEAVGIGVLVKRVEVGSDRSREEDGLLWDKSEARSEVGETNFGDVDAINPAIKSEYHR